MSEGKRFDFILMAKEVPELLKDFVIKDGHAFFEKRGVVKKYSRPGLAIILSPYPGAFEDDTRALNLTSALTRLEKNGDIVWIR